LQVDFANDNDYSFLSKKHRLLSKNGLMDKERINADL